MAHEQSPQADEYAPYYANYVALVPAGDIVAILATQLDDTLALLRELTDEQSRYRYAAGKWSVREVVGHVIDAERIFSYRALRFARGDAAPLLSFDENVYALAGAFDERPFASLLAEFAAVRRATVALFAGLPAEAWARAGIASENRVTVRGLAWIIAGHELHHRHILATRYITPSIAAG
jgi:uncharacterized damage-inducible protein DinB